MNEFNEVKKMMATHLKFLLHFGEMLKNTIWKNSTKEKKISKCFKKISFFKRQLLKKKFTQINSGLKNLKKNTGFQVKIMR